VSVKRYSWSDLVDIMARLRAPDGCPWDREQTHQSLLPYLLEESGELLEAIEKGDLHHMCEELGDVLLQVVFHAQVASEAGNFKIDDVVHGIAEKMVRRHPHVFGDEEIAESSGVLTRWEQIKATEKKDSSEIISLVGDVSAGLTALQYAQKIQKRVEKVGFDWPDAQSVLPKVSEELTELDEAIASKNLAHAEEELGDLLFTVVCVARKLGVDAEVALRRANFKFQGRFQDLEQKALQGAALQGSGTKEDLKRLLSEASSEELEELWQEVKRERKARG
jgi:tetrapyrrole methylase family protein/MazG family protein